MLYILIQHNFANKFCLLLQYCTLDKNMLLVCFICDAKDVCGRSIFSNCHGYIKILGISLLVVFLCQDKRYIK